MPATIGHIDMVNVIYNRQRIA